MLSIHIPGSSALLADQRTRLREAALILAGGIAVALFILVPLSGLVVLVACLSVGFAWLLGGVFRGRIDGILLCWAAVFPLGYYFTSFPREQAVITLDRLVVLFAFLGPYLAKRGPVTLVPDTLRHAGLSYVAFAILASFTLGKSPNPLNAARALLDSFLIPFLLAWCVIWRFDVRRRLPALHSAVCISSIISAIVAAAEVVAGQDLLPLGPSATVYAGIVRPNGPFESNDTLALIGGVSLFFLLFLREALGPGLSTGRKVLHSIGLAAAIAMALLPLFRSVAITLFLVLIIDTFWVRGTARRSWRIALILASAAVIFTVAALAPEVYEDRSSAGNIYGRVAEFEQSLHVFAEHPLLGVGFLNFHNYVAGEVRYISTYEGVTSLDWPHDNLAEVLTETGILGFVPYLLAQILLLKAMWELRKSSRSGRMVWKCFVYLFLTYWITGLTESSGYGPLNLWYLFVIAVLFKYALTEPDPVQASEDQASGEAINASPRNFEPVFLR
jgi:O-antigen ligase